MFFPIKPVAKEPEDIKNGKTIKYWRNELEYIFYSLLKDTLSFKLIENMTQAFIY
jgi:hypothetical protein